MAAMTVLGCRSNHSHNWHSSLPAHTRRPGWMTPPMHSALGRGTDSHCSPYLANLRHHSCRSHRQNHVLPLPCLVRPRQTEPVTAADQSALPPWTYAEARDCRYTVKFGGDMFPPSKELLPRHSVRFGERLITAPGYEQC